jgi:hypothetical protein
VPYIVAGTGGIPPQPVAPASGQPVAGTAGLTYDAAVSSFGYLYVTLSEKLLKAEFWQLGAQHTKAADTVTVDLTKHAVI